MSLKNINILEEAKRDFELFHSHPEEYKKNVDKLSELFKLKEELKGDYLPTYFVGDFEDKKNYKYILFGINPGFKKEQNNIEEKWKESSWDEYINNFVRNFFTLFKENNMESDYYKGLANLFSGLDNIELKDYPEIYDYYQEHIINLELIPYHSSGIGIPDNLKDEQRDYLKNRFDANINFVEKYLKKSNTKLMIFNGKPFYVLLIKNNIIKENEKIKLNEKVNMYTFKINGIPCVLFDKFITQPGFGLAYEDLKKIGKDIQKYI